MKKQLCIPILIIIIIIAGIILIVQNNKNNQIDESKEPIKIGAILPLSGEVANIGSAQRNAIELAVLEFKKDNIQLIFEDDKGCQPEAAVTAIQKIINIDKANAIVGSTCSGPTLTMAPEAEKNKVILISPSASSPNISSAGDYIFRVYPADDVPVKILTKFAFDKLKIRKAAVLVDSASDASVQEKNYVKNEFIKLGGNIVAEESFKTKDTDFKTQLLKIKNSGAKLLFFSGFPTETGLFLKQAKELNLNLPTISLDAVVENNDVIEIAKDAAEGIIYLTPTEPNNKEYLDFVSAYKSKYEEEPPAYSAEAYDAIRLAIMAIRKSDGTKEDTKDKLYQVGQNYMGASGKITFDKNGDVQKDFSFKTIKNGEFVPYEQ